MHIIKWKAKPPKDRKDCCLQSPSVGGTVKRNCSNSVSMHPFENKLSMSSMILMGMGKLILREFMLKWKWIRSIRLMLALSLGNGSIKSIVIWKFKTISRIAIGVLLLPMPLPTTAILSKKSSFSTYHKYFNQAEN